MTNSSNYIRIIDMEHSRVKKYKEYRDSFTKAGAENLDGSLKNMRDFTSTTNTLPINEVIKEVGREEEIERMIKINKRNQTIKMAVIISAAVILIGLTVFFGILAFGR